MKDIFIIECPVTGELKGISKRVFASLPSKFQENKDFSKWQQLLKEEGLSPIIKILDVVDDENVNLIFEMYLGLFKSWNLPFFNFPEITPKAGILKKILTETKIPKKYMINDLGYFESGLKVAIKENNKRRILEPDILYEAVLFALLYTKGKCSSEKLVCLKVQDIENFKLDSFSKQITTTCIYALFGSNTSNNDDNVFKTTGIYGVYGIINILNYLFNRFQYQIVINKRIWDNLPDLLKYFHCSYKYDKIFNLVELYNKIITNDDEIMSIDEYQRISISS